MSLTEPSRRTVVLTVVCGLAAATTASALAIAAAQAVCAVQDDPIHAAMANHQAAAHAVDTAHARIIATLPDVTEADHAVMQDALYAEIRAVDAMIATAPTTREGLQAFAAYLREERQHNVGMHIYQPGTLDDGRKFFVRDASGSEYLIAQRTAELA